MIDPAYTDLPWEPPAPYNARTLLAPVIHALRYTGIELWAPVDEREQRWLAEDQWLRQQWQLTRS